MELAKSSNNDSRSQGGGGGLEGSSTTIQLFDTNTMGNRLLQACKTGKLEDVKQLIQIDGIDLNYKDNKNWTALHMASYLGHKEIVHCLLQFSSNTSNNTCIDVNAKCDKKSSRFKGGETSLHFACDNCDISMAIMLLEHGANLTIQNNGKQTPLDITSSLNVITQVSKRYKEIVASINKKQTDDDKTAVACSTTASTTSSNNTNNNENNKRKRTLKENVALSIYKGFYNKHAMTGEEVICDKGEIDAMRAQIAKLEDNLSN